jgi:aspartyl-tRNA(Asn)/glutamyl-tRNA(Gln) amidotransferase subunit A
VPAADLADLGVADLAEGIRERQFSSLEATTACLARLKSIGPKLNAVAQIDEAFAVAQAEAADALLAAGRMPGPLHGVPLAHKDMLFREGRISACGTRILAGTAAEETATVLERLDAAGAIEIARLNMVEFALGPTGHNAITGHVRNPWDTGRITGGSSSGSAASVAARLVPAALGSDTGGSIRLPASICGVVGIKQTYGRVSRAGAMPLSFSLDHIGPLARSVRDAAMLLEAIAGPDPRDPTTLDVPPPDLLSTLELGVKGLRLAVPDAFPDCDGEVLAAFRAAVEVLKRAGAEIVAGELPDLDRANRLTTLVIAVEGAAYHANWLRERPQDYGPQTRARLLPGLYQPAVRYLESLSLRGPLLADFVEFGLAGADAFLMPTAPVTTPTIAETDVGGDASAVQKVIAIARYTRLANFLGVPAISVPAGFDARGLPIGLQIMGRPLDEALICRVARAYERETDWGRRKPSIA